MFGPVGTLQRTYYYSKETRHGHYPLDERLGLVGRYTPALVEEMVRAAADRPYREAAAEFSRAHHFDVSPDTLQDIVEKMRAEATKFTWLSDLGPKEDAKRIMDIVYVLVDGTGLPFRRSSLRGAKGKNGRAKTREAKMGVIFVGGVDSDGRPFRLSDTTTYVATTHRWGKFMKLLRAEFDRRFGQHPRKIVFISDGGKWITSVRNNEFPDSTFILDFFHAAEHLEPVLELMGLKKGTKAWKQKFRYYAKRMRQGKVLSVIASAEKACPKKGMPEFDKDEEGPQILQRQRKTWENGLRQVRGRGPVHRLGRRGKRLQDRPRRTAQAVRDVLVAQGRQGNDPAAHTGKVRAPRRVLQLAAAQSQAGNLHEIGMTLQKKVFAPVVREA